MGAIDDFIYKYFIEPIWARTGYNPINTATYAIIALLALFLIWKCFKKCNINVNKNFIYNVLTFVLLGSTVRVVTDSIDAGALTTITPVHQVILSSHIYDYGYLTVSPGIYFVIALMLFVTMAILWKIKKPELLGAVGLALWLPHFLILLPFMGFIVHTIPVLILAAIPAYLALRYFNNEILDIILTAHALDNGAKFYTIDIFSKISGKAYFEQHVVGGMIGQIFGTFFAFYVVKVLLAFAMAYVISKEKEMEENERNYISLAIMIMGFAPGIRSLIRLAVGV